MYYEALRLYESLFRKRYFQPIVKILLVSMASSVFYYFSCGVDNQVVGWFAAILIFLTGIFYIVAGIAYYLIYLEKFRVYTNLKIFYRIHRYRYFLKWCKRENKTKWFESLYLSSKVVLSRSICKT